MDTFWAKIISFIVVCVLGFLFVTKVWQPMNDSQSLMADQSNSTLNAVTAQVQSSSTIVNASGVQSTVTSTCVAGNTKTIVVTLKTVTGSTPVGSYTFTTSTSSGSYTVAQVVGSTKSFSKVESGSVITFTEI